MSGPIEGVDLARYNDREDLARALAAQVAGDLSAAIAARGVATLAVPGGTTPGPFLTALAQHEIAWDRVRVTLTDERWVPADDARSNQQLVAGILSAGPAAAAELVPLYVADASPEDGARTQSAVLEARLLPLDVCVLGMGADMHTASLFPGADRLAEALDPACPQALLPLHAPGAAEARVSLTAPAIRNAGRVYLLIHSAEKWAALEAAQSAASTAEAPVRVALERAGPVKVVYAA